MKTNIIKIQHYVSPCGGLRLGEFEGKLCLCNWTEEKHPGRVDKRLQHRLAATYIEETSDLLQEAIRELDEYFRGERQQFALPLLFVGTDFQKQVWQQLHTIPYGQTISYGEMARQLGCPTSVRAVANANGANAMSLFAPCHRVIGSNGSLTGFGGGIEAKKYLLALEARCR